MGCANSSPLANGAENIMGTAKSAAQDMKHTGEEMLNGEFAFEIKSNN